MTLYEFLKFLHVVLAIVAIGANATYGLWLARAAREPEHTAYALKGIKILDDKIANPAYALLLVTGFAMVIESDIPMDTFWIAAALVLFVILVVLALVGYTPTLRKQIAAVEAGRLDSDEYRALSKRGSVLGAVLGVLVIVIVFLMVTKPT
ncbi:MAG: DUF2269 family protein [Actinomycetota bacterium]